MSTKKVYYVMLGLVAFSALLTIGSIVLGTSMLQTKAAELTELKIQEQLIEEQQTALIQANKDIEKYQELESIAKTVVPRDKDQARTVREIVSLAEQSRIRVSSITFPSSSLGTKAPAPAKTTDDDGASSAPKVVTPPISQVKPVDGIPGLYQLEVTINVREVATSYTQLIDFLNRLEQNRRTAQVTSITIDPVGVSRNLLEFDLMMNVFVKP